MSLRIIRTRDWADPVPPARREVRTATPELPDDTKPPVLFVPGFGHGAWAYAEHWMEHAAGRGFAVHAVSPRGHGGSEPAPRATLRAYAHDVVQVAAALPHQAVLVGHGAGALVVAHALARYPAKAGVLAAPVFGGWATLGLALRRNLFGTLPAAFGGRLRLTRRQLFSRDLAEPAARGYLGRIGHASARAQWELLRARPPEQPVGDPPVLVVGTPDDRVVPRTALDNVARRYGGAPLLFPGMGHDLMLDARWQEPLDAILDWLEKGDH